MNRNNELDKHWDKVNRINQLNDEFEDEFDKNHWNLDVDLPLVLLFEEDRVQLLTKIFERLRICKTNSIEIDLSTLKKFVNCIESMISNLIQMFESNYNLVREKTNGLVLMKTSACGKDRSNRQFYRLSTLKIKRLIKTFIAH